MCVWNWQVTYCGGVGASRAFDYAVVDLFFVNTLSFMSNAASLEREGVEMEALFPAIAKRLGTVSGVLQMYHERMKVRDEDAYARNITCDLNTARSYWASRLPYNNAHGIPSHLANVFVELLDEVDRCACLQLVVAIESRVLLAFTLLIHAHLFQASGGQRGAHGGADLTRLQVGLCTWHMSMQPSPCQPSLNPFLDAIA